MHEIKPPLSIYVGWHERFIGGLTLAEEIFTFFNRDVKDSLARGIGIPVLYRSGKLLSKISEANSKFTAVVLLVDANMVIDENWNKYIEGLIAESQKFPKHFKIYPVAIEGNAFNLTNELPKTNFIRAYEHNNEFNYISTMLTHEFCRLLFDINRINEETDSRVGAPLKLFISHAKEDGVKFAKNLCAYINGATPLKTFFDANDIAFGYDFPQEIESHIHNSVFVAIHTDKYSSREWCRREVVLAKRHNRPMVLINLIIEGEDRSFPYMANVKTIRINQKRTTSEKNARITLFTLAETLRFKYQELFMDYLVQQFPIPAEERTIFSYPPELLTLFNEVVKDKKYILYPDPPLSQEELDILKLANNNLQFITPAMIPTVSKNKTLAKSNQKVGLSISEIEDAHHRGYGKMHLRDALVELSRYLLVSGYQLAYGGDVRYNSTFNFAQVLFDLARNYNKVHIKPFEKIENFVPYPIYPSISETERANLEKVAKLIDVTPPMEINKDPNEVLKALTAEDKVIWARSLTKMRILMNDSIAVRIIIGGKTRGFKGKYPGVIEEAYIALISKKPMFVIGGFGGAAAAIINALEGKKPEEMFEQFHTENPDYKEFMDLFNEEAQSSHYDLIDFDKLLKTFNVIGIEGLRNGLDHQENQTLFRSTNPTEIISLIFTGLGRIYPD
jgi:hypothetical protein